MSKSNLCSANESTVTNLSARTLGCLQEVRWYNHTNDNALNAHLQCLDIPNTRGNRRKFSRRRSRVCAQRLRTQLAFAGVLFFAGADVLVVAPTGMGKVSPVTPTFLLPASNPTRASAFKSPRSHKRFVLHPFF